MKCEKASTNFVMICTNASRDLDELGKNGKKFICLNDDIDHHEVCSAEVVEKQSRLG